jgi:hypothetical protein
MGWFTGASKAGEAGKWIKASSILVILAISWQAFRFGFPPVGRVGDNLAIESPFNCDYGYNISIGQDVEIGRNYTFIGESISACHRPLKIVPRSGRAMLLKTDYFALLAYAIPAFTMLGILMLL